MQNKQVSNEPSTYVAILPHCDCQLRGHLEREDNIANPNHRPYCDGYGSILFITYKYFRDTELFAGKI